MTLIPASSTPFEHPLALRLGKVVDAYLPRAEAEDRHVQFRLSQSPCQHGLSLSCPVVPVTGERPLPPVATPRHVVRVRVDPISCRLRPARGGPHQDDTWMEEEYPSKP